MSRLSQSIRRTSKQGTIFPATVLDILGNKATVQLSQRGAVYKMLNVVGGPVVIGQKVRVNFAVEPPFIMTIPAEITSPSSSRIKPLEPIAHMNTPIIASSGSAGEPPPPGVAYYNFFFAPCYGGSKSSGDSAEESRKVFGCGGYASGAATFDNFGLGDSKYDYYSAEGSDDSYSGFMVPRNVSTLKMTPVVRMTGTFPEETYIGCEADLFSINPSTGIYTSNSYDDSWYADPYASGTSINGCRVELQMTFPNIYNSYVPVAGDIVYIYNYYSQSGYPDLAIPIYLQGYLVEITG